jgi:hypothetical protein
MKARTPRPAPPSGPDRVHGAPAGTNQSTNVKQNSMEENGRSVAWQNGDIAGMQ